MITLGVHCAGPNCDVALLKDNIPLAIKTLPMKRGHDQHLPVLVQESFKQADISIAEVDRFSVCVGPGSFTGIRVGVAFVRGLALSCEKTAIGVTSLEAFESISQDNGRSIALSPAKRKMPDLSFWAQTFGRSGLEDPAEIGLPDLGEYLVETDTVFLSEAPGEELLVELQNRNLDWELSQSTALGVAKFAVAHSGNGLRAPSPVYARAPDAIPAKPVR